MRPVSVFAKGFSQWSRAAGGRSAGPVAGGGAGGDGAAVAARVSAGLLGAATMVTGLVSAVTVGIGLSPVPDARVTMPWLHPRPGPAPARPATCSSAGTSSGLAGTPATCSVMAGHPATRLTGPGARTANGNWHLAHEYQAW